MPTKLSLDPLRQTLHDSQGRLLKKLHCPKLKSWNQLTPGVASPVPQKWCESCDRAVLDTAQMGAADIIRRLKDDPQTCLAIRLDQENIEVKVMYG